MQSARQTIWQAIDAAAQQIPFSREKIENLFSTTLTDTDNTGNDVFRFLKSQPVELADGVLVRNIDLRIKRNDPHPGFMVLELEGSCIMLADVRKHYAELEITDFPRGRSPDDVTSHTTARDWGSLSFSFKERKPDCLASIAFDPKKG